MVNGKNYYMIYDGDVIKAINELTDMASKFKTAVFKALVTDDKIKKENIRLYLSYVNDFLSHWENFAEDMSEKMKNAKGSTGVRALKYEDAKEYIYAKHDYASVLPFADGLIAGIKDQKFKVASDVQDFFNHTVNQAFGDQPDTVAGLLDSVLLRGDGSLEEKFVMNDEQEAHLFDSAKSYAIVNDRDRVELYKAISIVVEFITDPELVKKNLDYSNIKLFVSVVNNIIEYITYSMTVYATRLYVINNYAYPYITRSHYSEATEIHGTGDGVDSLEITIMREVDEGICKDPKNIKKLIESFSNFTTMIGADSLFGREKPSYTTYVPFSEWKNVFCDKLFGNQLYTLLTKDRYKLFPSSTTNANISELNHMVKAAVYNNTQGIQGTSSPKQELFHIIRGVDAEHNTSKDYQQLAADLMKATCLMTVSLEKIINELIEWQTRAMEGERKEVYDVGTNNEAAETLRMLTDLYSEMASLFIHKGIEIEEKYNNCHSHDIKKATNDVSISIPGIDNVKSTTTPMSNVVPDTARMPIEMMSLYSLPAYESLQMYDEYVKTLGDLSNDMYYSEAFNFSDIINKIQSLLSGIGNKWKNFWNNKNVQSALKYAEDHEQALTSMIFDDNAKMNVLPFKNDGEKEEINPTFIFDNLISGLNKFDIKTVQSEEALNEFIMGLYPNKDVYAWFHNDQDQKGEVAAIKFRNYVLYAKDTSDASDKLTEAVPIQGAEIQKRLQWWLASCKGGKALYEAVLKKHKDIETAQNAIKAKMVNITNTIQQQDKNNNSQPTKDPGATPETNNQNQQNAQQNGQTQNNTQQTNNQQQQSNNNQQGNNAQNDANNMSGANLQTLSSKALTEINLAYVRLYSSVVDMFIFYIKTEYGYLKDAYSKGNQGGDQNTQNNNQ